MSCLQWLCDSMPLKVDVLSTAWKPFSTFISKLDWTSDLYIQPAFSPISPGIPSISELTFNATTRSLTCISTGGPAINVTWRMGGSELTVDGSTYQFMQTLTNRTTSTYCNVLTIVSSDLTPILGSIFTCEVENTRGTATMNITILCKKHSTV